MARQLTNVSGQVLSLQDSSGRWHTIDPDAIYSVDDLDERYYQTGETGEEVLWADVAPAKAKKSTATKDEE